VFPNEQKTSVLSWRFADSPAVLLQLNAGVARIGLPAYARNDSTMICFHFRLFRLRGAGPGEVVVKGLTAREMIGTHRN